MSTQKRNSRHKKLPTKGSFLLLTITAHYSLTKMYFSTLQKEKKMFPPSPRNTEVRKSKSSPTKEVGKTENTKVQETKMGPACSSISNQKDLGLKFKAKTST